MINKKTTRNKLFMVLCLFFNKTKLTLKRQFLFVVVDWCYCEESYLEVTLITSVGLVS